MTHSNLDELFSNLWDQYTKLSPQVKNVYQLIASREDQILNDHIALRTLNHPKLGIELLAKEFKKYGYQEIQTYTFEEKKLNAKHYEIPGTESPKVFISELKLECFSDELNNIVNTYINTIKDTDLASPGLSYNGVVWESISHADYEKLYAESEYAAWFSAFGFRANHFTVFVNALSSFEDLQSLNEFLKQNSFSLNTSGGEIKGSPEVLLEQSSTMADSTEIPFSDGKFSVPSVYYEFARRYEGENGKLYQGFVAKSADKIFESTNKKSS